MWQLKREAKVNRKPNKIILVVFACPRNTQRYQAKHQGLMPSLDKCFHCNFSLFFFFWFPLYGFLGRKYFTSICSIIWIWIVNSTQIHTNWEYTNLNVQNMQTISKFWYILSWCPMPMLNESLIHWNCLHWNLFRSWTNNWNYLACGTHRQLAFCGSNKTDINNNVQFVNKMYFAAPSRYEYWNYFDCISSKALIIIRRLRHYLFFSVFSVLRSPFIIFVLFNSSIG